MDRKKIGPPLRGINDLVLVPTDGGCSTCSHATGPPIFRVCGAHDIYCSPSPTWSRRHPIQVALFVAIAILLAVGPVTIFSKPASCKPYVEELPTTDLSVDCDHVDHTLTIEDGYVLCTCPDASN